MRREDDGGLWIQSTGDILSDSLHNGAENLAAASSFLLGPARPIPVSRDAHPAAAEEVNGRLQGVSRKRDGWMTIDGKSSSSIQGCMDVARWLVVRRAAFPSTAGAVSFRGRNPRNSLAVSSSASTEATNLAAARSKMDILLSFHVFGVLLVCLLSASLLAARFMWPLSVLGHAFSPFRPLLLTSTPARCRF